MSDTTPAMAPENAVDATEPVPAPDTPETNPEAVEGDTDGETDDDGNVSRREAKYRTKLRAAEAERDALAARLDAMQRTEAERIAATVLSDGGDLWRDGADLAAMLGDDGHLDPAKVTQAAKELAKAHPHWKAPGRRPATMDGQRSGATGLEVGTGTTLWRDALAAAAE